MILARRFRTLARDAAKHSVSFNPAHPADADLELTQQCLGDKNRCGEYKNDHGSS